MTKITDGYKTVGITMKVWDKSRNEWKYGGQDLSDDFFEDDRWTKNPSNLEDKLVVRDVTWCISQAEDWEKCVCDYCYDEVAEDEERTVFVDDLTVTAEDIASVLRRSDAWDMGLCAELCKMADMTAEWEAADAESYEDVLDKAAHKLDVELYKHE